MSHSIHTSVYFLETEYFELRLSQEKSLKDFKNKQSQEKSALLKQLKKCKGVSKLRIHQAITLYKNYTFKEPTERSTDVYTFVIDSMDRSFKRHYEENEAQIKQYITKIFELQDELKKFREEQVKKFNKCKRELHKNNINVSMLSLSYDEFKAKINFIKKEGITRNEFDLLKEQYSYLNEISKKFFDQEYNEYMKEFHDDYVKKENHRVYMEEINKMFNISKPKSTIELDVYNIVKNLLNDEVMA